MRSGVDFHYIQTPALVNFLAGRAFIAGLEFSRRPFFAIYGFSEDAGQGSFPDSPRAAKKIGVRDFFRRDFMLQSRLNVVLIYDFAESLRAVFSI